jgi:hypothetical protein
MRSLLQRKGYEKFHALLGGSKQSQFPGPGLLALPRSGQWQARFTPRNGRNRWGPESNTAEGGRATCLGAERAKQSQFAGAAMVAKCFAGKWL